MSGGPPGSSSSFMTRVSPVFSPSISSAVTGLLASAARASSSSSSQVDCGCDSPAPGGGGGGGAWPASPDGGAVGGGGSSSSPDLLRSKIPMLPFLSADWCSGVGAPEELCAEHAEQVHKHDVEHH